MNIDNINFQLVNMPTKIHGHSVKNEDGSYTAFINARLTQEAQIEAAQHEVDHIIKGDLDKSGDIQLVETLMVESPTLEVCEAEIKKRITAIHKKYKKRKRKRATLFKKYQQEREAFLEDGGVLAERILERDLENSRLGYRL